MNLREELLSLWKKAARHTQTAVFLLAGELCAMTVTEGKCLQRWSVPLAENLAESFRALKEKGMKKHRLTLLINEPSLQWERKKFPDMTDEEFEETIYWEEDRLFAGTEAMATGYRVLRHDSEGYDILFHGFPKEELTRWESAAHEAGLHITRAIPVTDIFITDDPYMALYGGASWGALFFFSENGVETRHLTVDEAGKAARFLEHIREETEGPLPCFLFPLSDAGEEDMEAWRNYLCEEIETLPEGESFVEVVALSETPLRSGMELLALSLERSLARLSLAMAGEGALFTRENRPLRIAQCACLLGVLFCLFAVGDYFHARHQWDAAETESQGLRPVKERLSDERHEEKEESDLLERLKELEKKSPRWAERLISLSDTIPQGVVLQSIHREGARILIKGTAASGEPLQSFTRSLSAAWGGRTALKGRKQNKDTGLLEFTVEWREDKKTEE